MGDSPIGRHSAIGRAAQPEEISGMVLYLASDAASFTTAQTFIVDGGQTAH
jgi:NAD(P)-dependent dehydrogenase (short-subunit alcohol dehydrogenase family)